MRISLSFICGRFSVALLYGVVGASEILSGLILAVVPCFLGPSEILCRFMLCLGGRSRHHLLAAHIAEHGCFTCQTGIRLGLIFGRLLIPLLYSLVGPSAVLSRLLLAVRQ